MNGPRMARSTEPGSCCTVATKMAPEELDALDAMAAAVSMSRYQLVRELLRQHIRQQAQA